MIESKAAIDSGGGYELVLDNHFCKFQIPSQGEDNRMSGSI